MRHFSEARRAPSGTPAGHGGCLLACLPRPFHGLKWFGWRADSCPGGHGVCQRTVSCSPSRKSGLGVAWMRQTGAPRPSSHSSRPSRGCLQLICDRLLSRDDLGVTWARQPGGTKVFLMQRGFLGRFCRERWGRRGSSDLRLAKGACLPVATPDTPPGTHCIQPNPGRRPHTRWASRG